MTNKIYHKVMAGVISYLLPLTSFLYISCSDFLEVEPLNEIVLENFWNEKADVDVQLSNIDCVVVTFGHTKFHKLTVFRF